SRLSPIARELGLPSIDSLVGKLRTDASAPLVHRVIEAMTTNETLFFRDLHPFEALRTRLVPDLLQARAAQRSLRIWCGAASTGQEPYSIAMTLCESFPQLASWDVKILATDLNATVLERAREGKYRQLEVNRGLPVKLLVKYFERQGADWQLKPDVRNLVTFQELNLLDAWSHLGEHDIIFLRNVLIYFDVETKRRILGRMRRTLRRDGVLVLGGAETTTNLDDGYVPLRIGNGVYYQLRSPDKVMTRVA
ncbi:MAG TPA: protein-glutamate O-methyltransferase CheR, partial [Polyangiaceae bacterium]|nr:protein-glutamate O-methyltransferase CheR [Polyangiaceae bacterium]